MTRGKGKYKKKMRLDNKATIILSFFFKYTQELTIQNWPQN